MTQAKANPWDSDQQFEDTVISRVEKTLGGWEINHKGSWIFFVKDTSPVEPKAGMKCRMYGRDYAPVRGLFLDGTCIYYRTEAEEAEHQEIAQYGRDAADVLARWDRGDSVWSVEMGGIGPGYEQAIQVAAFEILRHFVTHGYDVNLWDDKEVTHKISEEMQSRVMPLLEPLGLSGSQWGAAQNIASCLYRHGPRKALNMVEKERRILVSKNFPRLKEAA